MDRNFNGHGDSELENLMTFRVIYLPNILRAVSKSTKVKIYDFEKKASAFVKIFGVSTFDEYI